MENSSKALIIAGAILIAILLISVGIMVMNSVNKPIDEVESEADSQAIQMFNSQFIQYAGKNKSGSQVKGLLSKTATMGGVDKKRYIHVFFKPKGESEFQGKFVADIQHLIKNSSNYTVSFGTDPSQMPTNPKSVLGKRPTDSSDGYYCYVEIAEE